MNVTNMVAVANAYTDENFKANQALLFVNEAIGTVNAELKCSLPFIEDVNVEYTALNETWIRQILIPYICYSIKMNDSSINEANMFYRSYELGLQRISDNKRDAIAVEYQGSGFSNAYQIDYVSGLYNTFGIGAPGYAIAEYDPYKFYFEGSYVTYNDIMYVSIKDTTGNLPTNTTYWRVYS